MLVHKKLALVQDPQKGEGVDMCIELTSSKSSKNEGKSSLFSPMMELIATWFKHSTVVFGGEKLTVEYELGHVAMYF